MESIAAPLEADTPLPLPESGAALIVAELGCQRAQTIADHLREKGLVPVVTDPATVCDGEDVPSDLALLVRVLPEVETSFLECALEKFDDRVEGLAERLFRIFRRIGHGRQAPWSALRCLVLRPFSGADDAAVDLGAGHAFLRTLRLEYPGVHTKWVRVPIA